MVLCFQYKKMRDELNLIEQIISVLGIERPEIHNEAQAKDFINKYIKQYLKAINIERETSESIFEI